MCRRHHNEMIGMAATSAHESTLDLGTSTEAGDDQMEIDGPEDVCMGEGEDEDEDPEFKVCHVAEGYSYRYET